MSYHFSLTRKSDLNAGPVDLQEIDDEVCVHFGVVSDPNDYYLNWIETIGLMLALGKTLEQVVNDCHELMAEYPDSRSYYKRKAEIAEYLDQQFVPDGWAEIARH